MTAWDLSCPDWRERIVAGRPLVPTLPLFSGEGNIAVQFFDNLCMPDMIGTPPLKDVVGDWFRDIVRAIFGSRDPATNERFIRESFLLAPKGSSKTSNFAGLLITAMLMNNRPRAEMLFVGPVQATADLAFNQAAGMIEANEQLRARFRPVEHIKEIKDLRLKSVLKIRTFDINLLTGRKPVFVFLDEVHLLARNHMASKVIFQLRSGIRKSSEGFFAMASTQSDSPPAGVFLEELKNARAIRDGTRTGVLLPILYEFPENIAHFQEKWKNQENWGIVNPNLGRSVKLPDLIEGFQTATDKGDAAIRIWASQQLNIEIGLGLVDDMWAGARFWERSADPTLTLDDIIRRCDVATIGIDGGGLDDLLGFCIIGRERNTRKWLMWHHAWCHRSVLDIRKEIAPKLLDFERDGDLTIIDHTGDDVEDIADLVERLENKGLLPFQNAIGVDRIGIDDIIDALAMRDFDVSKESGRIAGLKQGWELNNAIETTARRFSAGDVMHCGSAMMAWCVANAKVEPRGNAVIITKQVSGKAKIDPFMAMLDASTLMSRNPTASISVFDGMSDSEPQTDVEPKRSDDIDAAILADPKHPMWQEMRQRYERQFAAADEDF